MAAADDFRRIALALEGTLAGPHFDRTAFKVSRIYATLAADGLSANIKLTPEDQHFKCLAAPEIFAAIPNAWGRQGWTSVDIAKIDKAELAAVLEKAWTAAVPKRPRARRGGDWASR